MNKASYLDSNFGPELWSGKRKSENKIVTSKSKTKTIVITILKGLSLKLEINNVNFSFNDLYIENKIVELERGLGIPNP